MYGRVIAVKDLIPFLLYFSFRVTVFPMVLLLAVHTLAIREFGLILFLAILFAARLVALKAAGYPILHSNQQG